MWKKRRVGILIFPDVELLDFCGPFEVFSVVRLDESRRREEGGPYEVFTVAEEVGEVEVSGGLRVIADHSLASCPALDVLVVPGGWGVRPALERPGLLDWIARRSGEVEVLASVCTGSWLLGKAGLLEGRRATTHWMRLDWLRENVPGCIVVEEERVVEDGAVVTSAGIASGIDLALRVVARQHGERVARATAAFMEYPYPETNEREMNRFV